jgi:hypothetical protein
MKKSRTRKSSRWHAIRVLGPNKDVEQLHFLDKYGRLVEKGPQFRRRFDASDLTIADPQPPPAAVRTDVPVFNQEMPSAVSPPFDAAPLFNLSEAGNGAVCEDFVLIQEIMMVFSDADPDPEYED